MYGDLPSLMTKHSLSFRGHKYSVSLEAEFWRMFKAMARDHDMTLGQLYWGLEKSCPEGSTMTSHIRTTILNRTIARARAA